MHRLMGRLTPARHGLRRAARPGHGRYVALILLVALVMAGVIAAMKGFRTDEGKELGDVIIGKIKEACARWSSKWERPRRTGAAHSARLSVTLSPPGPVLAEPARLGDPFRGRDETFRTTSLWSPPGRPLRRESPPRIAEPLRHACTSAMPRRVTSSPRPVMGSCRGGDSRPGRYPSRSGPQGMCALVVTQNAPTFARSPCRSAPTRCARSGSKPPKIGIRAGHLAIWGPNVTHIGSKPPNMGQDCPARHGRQRSRQLRPRRAVLEELNGFLAGARPTHPDRCGCSGRGVRALGERLHPGT